MKGRVRRHQWIDGRLTSLPNILLREKSKPVLEKEEFTQVRKTTAIVCDGWHMKVGVLQDGNYCSYYVMDYDHGMRWNDYTQYFSSNFTRVITCYLKMGRSLEGAAENIAKFIETSKIEGRILLIGFAEAGLMMYRAANLISEERRSITVITVAAPFADAAAENNQFFSKPLEPLSEQAYHFALISTATRYNRKNALERFFTGKREYYGDLIVPFQDQALWPETEDKEAHEPETCLTLSIPYNEAFAQVLSDFGKFSASEFLFSKLSDFGRSDAVRELIGEHY